MSSVGVRWEFGEFGGSPTESDRTKGGRVKYWFFEEREKVIVDLVPFAGAGGNRSLVVQFVSESGCTLPPIRRGLVLEQTRVRCS